MKTQIEYLPIDGLVPYARNSRTHDDAQVAQIAASIREFGFTNPVLVDADGGIIAGHGRVLAARKLNMATVPCIELAGMTETQKRAYIIADNKLALNAGWDMDTLAVEIKELEAEDFDLALLGFTPDELAAMVSRDPVPLDEVDEIKEECVIQIICKDWNERESAIAKLGGKKIDWLDIEGMLR